MDRVYLTLDDVLWIHEDQLRRYGSASGVRDEGLTLSALLRPQTGYYADVIEEAAASRFHRLKQARGACQHSHIPQCQRRDAYGCRRGLDHLHL